MRESHYSNIAETGLLACASELGAGKKGTADGVLELSDWVHNQYGLPVTYAPVVNKSLGPQIEGFLNAKQILLNLQSVYYEALKHFASYQRSYVISGDHSNALAVFSAFSDMHSAASSGLIWVDAHADLHSPYTSPSGNIHGMPLGALLAIDNQEKAIRELSHQSKHWWNIFKDLSKQKRTPKLLPENLLIIGLRDYEKQEEDLISRLNIQYIKPEACEVEQVNKSMQLVRDFATRHKNLYVSFDIDSLDAALVPGTGTPVSKGLNLDTGKALLSLFRAMPHCSVIEFTEYNPSLDVSKVTQNTVLQMLEHGFER